MKMISDTSESGRTGLFTLKPLEGAQQGSRPRKSQLSYKLKFSWVIFNPVIELIFGIYISVTFRSQYRQFYFRDFSGLF